MRRRVVSVKPYTAKSYVLNQNWNQSDPDLYPEIPDEHALCVIFPNLISPCCYLLTHKVVYTINKVHVCY